MGDEAAERFFARLAQEAGTPPLTAAEIDEVLKLAKVVAHRVERRFAPLASYAAGLVITAGTDSPERVERLRALIDDVLRLAPEFEGQQSS